MTTQYPFVAILGGDPGAPQGLSPLGLGLVLSAVDPRIGGVLVRGHKGTAKSTAVRALAAVLPPVRVHEGDRFSADPDDPTDHSPDGPLAPGAGVVERPVRLVELPVGATEDRVIGSIHLETALTEGAVRFEPGLLAQAHRGLLYVDEVNLLHDHLVDLVLDAAATGTVTVERDGVSLQHSARFVLVGTMNPEEGELRPQLLDRFGLTVEVTAPDDAASRVEVVRRRMAFDASPAEFVETWAPAQAALTDRVARARAALGSVRLGPGALLRIAQVCVAFEVEGLRADIVTARAAAAHAAWQGRDRVTLADIRAAALLSLPHRRRRDPFDAPGLDEDLLDRVLGGDEPDPDPGPGGPQDDQPEGEGPGDGDGATDDGPAPGPSDTDDREGSGHRPVPVGAQAGPPATDAGQDAPGDGPDPGPGAADPGDGDPADGDDAAAAGTAGAAPRYRVDHAGAPYRPRLLTVAGVGHGAPGRRSRALGTSGRRVGTGTGGSGLHLLETLRAAASRLATEATAAAAGADEPAAAADATDRSDRSGDDRAVHGPSTREGPVRARRVRLRPADLRTAVREGRESNLLVLCVDASGSMAARRRMVEVKTAVLSLLGDAYRRRDRVALITFRGDGAQVVLPPTGSVDIAATLLDDLPAGGRTPVAEGLLAAADLVRRERARDQRVRPLLLLVSDGRATSGPDAIARSRWAADRVAALTVPCVVLDPERGPIRLGLARVLADRLRAEHLEVARLDAAVLSAAATGRAA